jgi:hypothetical protein
LINIIKFINIATEFRTVMENNFKFMERQNEFAKDTNPRYKSRYDFKYGYKYIQ